MSGTNAKTRILEIGSGHNIAIPLGAGQKDVENPARGEKYNQQVGVAVEEASCNYRPSQLGQPCNANGTSYDAFLVCGCPRSTQHKSCVEQPSCFDLDGCQRRAPIVANDSRHLQRTTNPSPSLDDGDVDRCISDGMGSRVHGAGQIGNLDRSRSEPNIQLPRASAVLRGVSAFSDIVRRQHLLIHSDNMTTVANVSRQGGAHSPQLIRIVKELQFLVLSLQTTIQIVHIHGCDNVLADAASRDEYALTQTALKKISRRFGMCPQSIYLRQAPTSWCPTTYRGDQRRTL